ncbi:MAG: hypothetical protein IT294_02825 [Deltaproteobacteria bacterium]|nr:hypothetical protein [Deltaproteobacteria bacterium]
MTCETGNRRSSAGALALLVGLLALVVPRPFGERPTWQSLLAPYSSGALLPGGFRAEEIRRGPDNGVVVGVRRASDGATVEVLVVERGRWESPWRSRSFTIDYELPRSSAAEREAVTALLAETISARDAGLPAPDAVPLRVDDASVLPWWFETLRGARGFLLGASGIALAALLLLRAPGLAPAGVALGVADVAARIIGVPPVRPDVGAVWIVPAAVGLLVLASRGRGFRPGPGVRPALAVAALALCVRLALGPWGPLHVNGHGPRFVAGAAGDAADIAAYGPGYRELFGPLAAAAPSNPDWAIFAGNAVLSALLPPLAFAIGRMTGLAPSAAFVAALLLAIDPVAIRTGATEAYFAPIAFFCTAAGVAMLTALGAMEAGGRWRVAALLVAAGLLLSQAARIHPCAWVPIATAPFVVLAGDVGSRGRRARMALAAAAIGGGVLALTSASVLLDVFGNIRAGTVFRPPLPPLQPLAWAAFATAAYAVVAPRRRLALPAGIAVAAMVLTRHAFDASWIWQQAYLRLYLIPPLIAVLACVPPAWLRLRRRAASVAIVVVLAWVRFGWPVVAARTTDHLEYRWIRKQVRRLPPECRVVHVAFAGRRVLMLPTYAGPTRTAVAMDPRRAGTVEAALAPADCLYYVRGSLCSTLEGRPECAAIERRLTLAPVARASFPVAHAGGTFEHEGDTVETMVARVEHVAPADRP